MEEALRAHPSQLELQGQVQATLGHQSHQEIHLKKPLLFLDSSQEDPKEAQDLMNGMSLALQEEVPLLEVLLDSDLLKLDRLITYQEQAVVDRWVDKRVILQLLEDRVRVNRDLGLDNQVLTKLKVVKLEVFQWAQKKPLIMEKLWRLGHSKKVFSLSLSMYKQLEDLFQVLLYRLQNQLLLELAQLNQFQQHKNYHFKLIPLDLLLQQLQQVIKRVL